MSTKVTYEFDTLEGVINKWNDITDKSNSSLFINTDVNLFNIVQITDRVIDNTPTKDKEEDIDDTDAFVICMMDNIFDAFSKPISDGLRPSKKSNNCHHCKCNHRKPKINGDKK